MKKGKQQNKNGKPDTTFRYSVAEEKGDEVIIEVSPEDYAREMAAGISPGETLVPGRHEFIRGGFRKRHPDYDSKNAQARVGLYLCLDRDVLEYFKNLAARSGRLSVEAQINQALRQFIEAQANRQSLVDELLGDADFIAAVAAQVKTQQASRKTRKGPHRRKAA